MAQTSKSKTTKSKTSSTSAAKATAKKTTKTTKPATRSKKVGASSATKNKVASATKPVRKSKGQAKKVGAMPRKMKKKSHLGLKIVLVVLMVLLLAAAAVGIALLVLAPRYNLEVVDATVKTDEMEDSVRVIKAELERDCQISQKDGMLTCQVGEILGSYDSNRDVEVFVSDNAKDVQVENGEIKFKEKTISIKPVVIRSEDHDSSLATDYTITLRDKDDGQEKVRYELTILTYFSKDDLAVINKKPTGEEIRAALNGKIEDIGEICVVTEENDPAKTPMLNKPGGYTAKVVFADRRIWLEQQMYLEMQGGDLCKAGNSMGGSIEIFATKEDAEKRGQAIEANDETMSSIFGGVDSGAWKVVGTALVRTSSELTNSQQQELEKQIIEVLTK